MDVFGINLGDEFVEDRSIVEIIGGGGEVRVDEPKQLKVEIFPFLDELDERVDDLHLREYRFLHHYSSLSMC